MRAFEIDPPEGEHGLVQRFEATESSVLEARHLVARHLSERSVPRTLVDEAVLPGRPLQIDVIHIAHNRLGMAQSLQ